MKIGDKVIVKSVSDRADHCEDLIGAVGEIVGILGYSNYEDWMMVDFKAEIVDYLHDGFQSVKSQSCTLYAIPPEDLGCEADVVEKILEQYDV